jgi:hypothetical protein
LLQQVFDDPSLWDGDIGPQTKTKLDQLAGPPMNSATAQLGPGYGLTAPEAMLTAEAATPVPCQSDLSAFGLARREQEIRGGRQPRPQLVAGGPFCPGKIDLVQSGQDGSTFDLLLWNFDIDGAYTKVQHESALDRLILELHRRLIGADGAAPTATSYRILLSGFARRTGSVAYN